MAIDTDNEKLALMDWCSIVESGLPISPGTFGQDDKQQLLWDYPGIVWGGAVAVNSDKRGMQVAIEYESILADVTPSDTDDLTDIGMLYIGTAGDVKVTGISGGTVVLKNVPNGTWLNFIRVKKVFATLTTATNIVLAR